MTELFSLHPTPQKKCRKLFHILPPTHIQHSVVVSDIFYFHPYLYLRCFHLDHMIFVLSWWQLYDQVSASQIRWTMTIITYITLLMEEILHQLIGNVSHCLQGCIHPKVVQDFFHQQHHLCNKSINLPLPPPLKPHFNTSFLPPHRRVCMNDACWISFKVFLLKMCLGCLEVDLRNCIRRATQRVYK